MCYMEKPAVFWFTKYLNLFSKYFGLDKPKLGFAKNVSPLIFEMMCNFAEIYSICFCFIYI